MVLTFVRGLFWVVSFPVWTGDEGAHYSYEQSVATGLGIPISGHSLNSADTLRLVKESPVSTERTFPLPPTQSSKWGIVDEQYEGLQAPLYYLLSVPAYWIGRSIGGLDGSFYALRLFSLFLAVAAIPLVALLARGLLPGRRAVWLLAPAMIAFLQIVNVQNSYVDNDSLTIVAGAACLLALLASHNDLRARRAALFGGTLAAALLTKATLAALLPALLIAMVAYTIRARPGLRQAAVWVAAAAGTFVAIVLPFLVFNLTEYHALSGARAAAALVKPVIGPTPTSLTGAWRLTVTFLQTLFVGQGIAQGSSLLHYQRLWEWTTVLGAGAALGGALVRRRRDELAKMAWIVLSIPLGVLTLIVLGFNQSGVEATVVARYLDCLLPLFAIMIGYGSIAVLGSRVGSITLLAVLVVGSFLEVAADRAWLTTTYTAGIVGNSVPAVEQSYADGTAFLSEVRASAACPVDAVGLNIIGHSPLEVTVNGRQSLLAMAVGPGWTVYRLSHSVEGSVVIGFPAPLSLGTAHHVGSLVSHNGNIAISDSGLPTLRLYCPVADAARARFDVLYPTNHPPLSFGSLLAWPEVESWTEVAFVGAVAVVVVLGDASLPGANWRRRRSSSG